MVSLRLCQTGGVVASKSLETKEGIFPRGVSAQERYNGWL